MAFLDYAGLIDYTKKLELKILNKVTELLQAKQNSLTAGEGVSLENDTVSIQEPVKEVTQVQYDALTDEEKSKGLYVVTDATINLNDHGDIYSTDETRIGTWIDGKPLYRKTVSGSEYNGNNNLEIATNVDTPVAAYGVAFGSKGAIWFIPAYESLSNLVQISKVDETVTLRTAGFANYRMTITFEYTKTTDPTLTKATQTLSVNSLTSASKAPERVVTSQVPLPSYVQYAPASASASSARFTFAPASATASASSTHLTL